MFAKFLSFLAGAATIAIPAHLILGLPQSSPTIQEFGAEAFIVHVTVLFIGVTMCALSAHALKTGIRALDK